GVGRCPPRSAPPPHRVPRVAPARTAASLSARPAALFRGHADLRQRPAQLLPVTSAPPSEFRRPCSLPPSEAWRTWRSVPAAQPPPPPSSLEVAASGPHRAPPAKIAARPATHPVFDSAGPPDIGRASRDQCRTIAGAER